MLQEAGHKDGSKGGPRSSLTLYFCALAPSPCSWCPSVRVSSPAPHPVERVAMSRLQLMNKPCKTTHPLQMLLYTTPLNLLRGPHSTILWFTSTVLIKLSQSFGCSWSISATLQRKISSGESWWLKDKTGETVLFLHVLWRFLCVSLPVILFFWPITFFPSCIHKYLLQRENRCLKIHS